jgi:hypothetical protein
MSRGSRLKPKINKEAIQKCQNKKEGTVRKYVVVFLSIVILFAFLVSCVGVVYVPQGPPPPKKEMKSPRPNPKAVWIDGHWKWSSNQWIWAPGHWVKEPKGHWVPGQWKKTPRGYKWVKGHWRK